METKKCSTCDELLPSYANYCGICGETVNSLEFSSEKTISSIENQNGQKKQDETQQYADDVALEEQQRNAQPVTNSAEIQSEQPHENEQLEKAKADEKPLEEVAEEELPESPVLIEQQVGNEEQTSDEGQVEEAQDSEIEPVSEEESVPSSSEEVRSPLSEETQPIAPILQEVQASTAVAIDDIALQETGPMLEGVDAGETPQGDGQEGPIALKLPTVPRVHAVEAVTSSTPYAFTRSAARPATVNVGRRPRSGRTTAPLMYDTPTVIQNFDDLGDGTHRQMTWEKNVDISPHRTSTAPPLTPRPMSSVQQRPILLEPQRSRRQFKPTVIFWSSFGLLMVLLLGGLFGIFITLGQGWLNPTPGKLSLIVTPNSVAVGATMTLRGSSFTMNGRIGLTRDTAVPIVDTNGDIVIDADSKGSFADTVVVGADWSPGPHTINAEDASTHKSAAFSVLVTGKGDSLRPAHLALSLNSLDLGSGDQATNSTRTITLFNAGGGQITWKSEVTRPWLLVSPKSGTFVGSQSASVTIAIDRSSLSVGPYQASIIFSSNAGDATLPIKMQVTPLLPGHEAVLQLSPAVLSFSAVDGSSSPPGQVITVSNPGVQALSWRAAADVSWLSVSPRTGNIASSSAPLIITGNASPPSYLDARFGMGVPDASSQPVTISVNTSQLLPGSYSGVVTFSNAGSQAVKNSPQSVYINVTILPQCSLQVSPSLLSFAGVYLQAAPPAKTISVGGATSCTGSLSWTAISNASWLSISSTSGATPASLAVSVTTANMTPGTYNSSITFTSSAGTQVLPVTFTLGQPTTPIMMTAPATMSFNGIVGQSDPAAQPITVTNSGGGTLAWNATATTAVGGAWLNLSLAGGTLTGGQSATVNVSATVGKSLIPGTYTGTITITGVDGSGNAAAGSPQSIPVTFIVQAACGLTPTPTTLTFAGSIGQTAPAAQVVSIAASGACANPVNWTVTAATVTGGNWLSVTPATGASSIKTAGATSAAVLLTGLKAGTYTGTLTIAGSDSITNATIGTPQTVTVTLTVQPPCTLQAPSVNTMTFTTVAGTSPAAQTFTVSVTGACTGNVTITPTITLGSGTGWLTVTPTAATILSGGSATLSVAVVGTGLTAGSYTASISLAAVNGGVAIVGSPQTVGIALTVTTAPALTASPASQTINVTSGSTSQPFTITNSGGGTLNWTAALGSGAPSFITLSATSGTGLAGGASATDNVVVNATGVPGGKSYTVTVTVSAIDPTTNAATAGSPVSIPVTVNVAAPAMQLSSTSLTFTAVAGGSNPTSQSIVITDAGGDTLTWTVGTPSQNWLSVSPTSGSDKSGVNSSVAFSINTSALTAKSYTATVTITPSAGTAQTVTVALTVSGTTPTPSLTVTPSPTPTPTPIGSPSSTPIITSSRLRRL